MAACLVRQCPEMFDAILLDAPCSGEGVVRKDPDALKNWSPESNQEIAATQRELIDSAFHALRPGGTLVYSTCTLNQEENEAVCLWLQRDLPRRSRVFTTWRSLPWCKQSADRRRLFACFPTNLRLRRLLRCFVCVNFRRSPPYPPKYKVGNFPFSPVKDREAGQIRQAAEVLV